MLEHEVLLKVIATWDLVVCRIEKCVSSDRRRFSLGRSFVTGSCYGLEFDCELQS